MDFINWYFDTHYIWSTILSPVGSMLWAIYHSNFDRFFGGLFVYFMAWMIKLSLKKRD